MKKLNKITVAMAALASGCAFAQSDPYNLSWHITPIVNMIDLDWSG